MKVIIYFGHVLKLLVVKLAKIAQKQQDPAKTLQRPNGFPKI